MFRRFFDQKNFKEISTRRLRLLCLPVVVTLATVSSATLKSFALSKKEYDTQASLGFKYVNAEHYDQAYKILKPLAQTPFANPYLYVCMAECCRQELGNNAFKLAQGIWYCKKAVQIDSDYGFAYAVWGEIVALQSKHDEAIILFTRALSCKQPHWNAYYLRAKSYAASKRFAEALKDLDKWDQVRAEKFPDDKFSGQAASAIRGQVLEALGKYDEAIVAFRASYPHYRSPWTEQEILQCLVKGKHYKEAIAELSNRITKNKGDDESYYARGKLRALMRDYQGAVNDYTSAIGVESSASYFKERSKAYEHLGKADLAKKDLDKANSL